MAAQPVNPLARAASAPGGLFMVSEPVQPVRMRRPPPKAPFIPKPRPKRIWRPGPRPAPPLTAAGMLSKQLNASIAAVHHPNEGVVERAEATHDRWLEQMEARQRRQKAVEERRRRRREDEADLLDAQLDALSVMTSGEAFINVVDRNTLLRLLAEMGKLTSPLEPSPLASPEIMLGEHKPDVFRIRPQRVGEGVMDSGSSNAQLDNLVTRTITFAHRRAARLKQEQQERAVQRHHRSPPKPPPPRPPQQPQHAAASAIAAFAAKQNAQHQHQQQPASPPPWPVPRSPAADAAASAQPAATGKAAFQLGQRWWRLPSGEKPSNRVELEHDALSRVLARRFNPLDQKVVLSTIELMDLDLSGVQANHVLRIGSWFFSPIPPSAVPVGALGVKANLGGTWRALTPTGTLDEQRHDREIEKRLGAQHSLGLVRRLLTEHQVRDAQRQAAKKSRMQRLLEVKRKILDDKAAAALARAARRQEEAATKMQAAQRGKAARTTMTPQLADVAARRDLVPPAETAAEEE